MTSSDSKADQDLEDKTITSRKRTSTTPINRISLTNISSKKCQLSQSKPHINQVSIKKSFHQFSNNDKTKILDNRSLSSSSSSSSTNPHTPSLSNTRQLSLKKQNLLESHQVESFNSISSEKAVLMNSAEQSSVVQPLLTDLYQISMAYAYFKAKKHEEKAVFDLFFRKNPFGGEYTLFAGLGECLKFVRDYKFHQSDIDYLRQTLPSYVEEEFFKYLSNLDMNDIQIYAVPEGTVVFPRIPLLRVEGPVFKTQLLETTLLTLVNFASLVATNAARFRQATGKGKHLLEFGLRRAQGPDGGLSASKYCYLGGFDGTSNVLAGKLYGIPVKGTHAHAYVSSYECMDDLTERDLADRDTKESRPFADLCLQYLQEIGPVLGILPDETNKGELAAFISYAIAFPDNFLALVDTYNVLKSGLPNFLAVARALDECHYKALGLRLDSGDLAYLSLEVRAKFKAVAAMYNIDYFKNLTIVASNDINEDTLVSLEKQGHSIDTFGIGTHLVTCQKQPALGCVYKLVELAGIPRIKVSQDSEKVTIPGRKNLYRIFGQDKKALCDVLTNYDEPPPEEKVKILIRHPAFEETQAYVTPKVVQSLYKLYWSDGEIQQELPSLENIRIYAAAQLAQLRQDHIRDLNPTPYKVSLTASLYKFMHDLRMKNVPIGELK